MHARPQGLRRSPIGAPPENRLVTVLYAASVLTGWEPEVPADDTLLRRWVLTSGARSTTLTERVGGRVHRAEHADLFDAGSPVVFDNGVILRRPLTHGELDDVVGHAGRFFPPERPWLLMSAWPLPDLASAGLRLMGHPPFMVRLASASATPPPPPPGLEIRSVTPELAATFGATLEECYAMPGAGASPWSDPRLFSDDVAAFLGYVDGEPIGTAAAFLAHGIVDVEMISCHERCRGRGIGEALTWAATRAHPDSVAMLMASDDGRRLYERMGYVAVTRMTLWYRSDDAL